jgi:hypothetical protein
VLAPAWEGETMQLTDATLHAMLSALIAADGPLDPAGTWAGLATAVADAQDETLMADVTPAPGALATRLPITTWVGPYRMNDGRWVVDSPVKTWTPASEAEGVTLTHWYLADALVAGALVGFGMFSPNLVMVDNSSRANLVVRVTLDPLGRWSAEMAWNG